MKKNPCKVVYVDKKGNKWTGEHIEELIEGYASFKDFIELLNHYKSML